MLKKLLQLTLIFILFITSVTPISGIEGQSTNAGAAKTIDNVVPGQTINDSEFDNGAVLDPNQRCSEFEDVMNSDTACKYLHKAIEKSVVTKRVRFYANAPVSRAQFAAMIVRGFGFELNPVPTGEGFADISTSNTFHDQIITLQNLGIISGTEIEGQLYFHPGYPITRGQAIKVIVNAMEVSGRFTFEGYENYQINSKFQDDLNNDVFLEYLKKLYASESKMPEMIVKGYSDGYIRTGRFISRAEAAIMIVRAMRASNIIEDIEEVPVDNSDISAVGGVCGEEIEFEYNGDLVTYGTISKVDLCWMDRNLGAESVPETAKDTKGYGDLFQWGRADDGHQSRFSGSTDVISTTEIAGHSDFILAAGNWNATNNVYLWVGNTSVNNPCPEGWRVPSEIELKKEVLTWSSSDPTGAFKSELKWPLSGLRNQLSDSIEVTGAQGRVWTSTATSSSVQANSGRSLMYGTNSINGTTYKFAQFENDYKPYGFAVRCVSDISE